MSMMLRMAGTLGQRRMSPLHPMTRDYIARLQAVDGHEPAFDAANDYLIRELVNLGGAYWDTMGTMTTLVGKKWEGLLVPLRDGMDVGTNVDGNFVSGDFDAKTGLKGDGSSKCINSNLLGSSMAQGNSSFGVFCQTGPSVNSSYINNGRAADGTDAIDRFSATQYRVRSQNSQQNELGFISGEGYLGVRRTDNAEFIVRRNEANEQVTRDSQPPLARNYIVFARPTSGFIGFENYSDARLSLYHIGPGVGINLAVLDDILTEYMARIDEVTL